MDEPTVDAMVSGPEWMERIRNGETAAFEALFHTYAPGLCAFVSHYLSSPDLAEDLVQELFLHLWRRRESLHFTGNIRTYLFRAAKHRALNHIRHERVAKRFRDGVITRTDADRGSGETELLEMMQVREAIEGLPERRQLIFTLSRERGMSNRAIAKLLGLSVRTVEAQISLALKALRTALR